MQTEMTELLGEAGSGAGPGRFGEARMVLPPQVDPAGGWRPAWSGRARHERGQSLMGDRDDLVRRALRGAMSVCATKAIHR